MHTYLQTCLRFPFQNQRLSSRNKGWHLKCSFTEQKTLVYIHTRPLMINSNSYGPSGRFVTGEL